MTLAISSPPLHLSRRSLLAALPLSATLLGTSALTLAASAKRGASQDVPLATPSAQVPATPFSFDMLTEEMRVLAQGPYVAPTKPESFLDALEYDDYRLIQYNPERARWQDANTYFRVQAFHMGWLFEAPVGVFEVEDGMARPLSFTTDDFRYYNKLAGVVPAATPLPGVAGFRINYPLNRPDRFDELVAFVGASYFRSLGQGNSYGISARGLAINTGLSIAEEFPSFTRFYLEKPAPGANEIVISAVLEGPSVTGAYRFVVTPGIETAMEVTARLFFRADVAELGIAPLTSMFLFAESNRRNFDDYRPQVHDSDGLQIRRADGDVLWRALNNPARLASGYFGETSPLGFGLHQRDREFENYQDPGARYHDRPSVDVDMIGDWGKGAVRLVEIPSDSEVNDNIVAFWVPQAPALAGEAREFAYRLRWGSLSDAVETERAYVYETRTGHAGASGAAGVEGTRKFVIDFKGGVLGRLPFDALLEPVIEVAKGEVLAQSLEKLDGTDIWRLAMDVSAADANVVELGAHLAGYGRKLTEVWLYQWVIT